MRRHFNEDLERGTLRVGRALVREGGSYGPGETKTKRGRHQIRLTAQVVNAFKTHRKKQLEERMKFVGLYQIRLHDLRHTCAALLLATAFIPSLVQELLGHATIAMTLDTYSHYLPSMGDRKGDGSSAFVSSDLLGIST